MIGVGQLSDWVDELKMDSAGRKSFELRMSDVRKHVSECCLDERATCSNGFNGNIKLTVRTCIAKFEHVTSNALAVINRYAATANHTTSP